MLLRRSFSLLRRRTLSRYVFAVATSRSLSTALTSVTANQVPAPSNLKSVRRDLARVLNEDAADLTTDEDPNIAEYLRAQRYVEARGVDGTLSLARKVGDVSVRINFTADADDDNEQPNAAPPDLGASENAQADDASADAGGDGDGAGAKMLPHTFFVELRNDGGGESISKPLLISCYADGEGVLNVDSLEFSDSSKEVSTMKEMMDADADADMAAADDDGDKIFFDDLSDGGQDKLLAFLDAVGVDDTLAQFVQHYAAQQRAHQFTRKLKQLSDFVNADAQ